MATKVTFNTLTKTVKFNSGVTSVDFKTEVYSDAKEDWVTDSSLRKYSFPFVSIGGNTVTGGKVIEPTFFLLGDWQMEPASEDHEVTIFGNVFHDAGLALVKVPASYAIVINLSTTISPDLKNASVVRDAAEYGTYDGGVTIDVTNGMAGTEYPIGTPGTPSNNLADAHTILQSKELQVFFIRGSLTLDVEDFSQGVTFEGRNPVVSSVSINPGTNVNNCEFRNLTVTGTADNANVFQDCLIGDVTSFDGFIRNCGLGGTITLGGSSQTTINECISTIAGTATPIIDIGSGSKLAMRGYNGGIKFINKIGTDDTSIDLASGQVIVDSTCTAGTITLRGNGELTDNSSGTNVVDKMLHGGKVTNLQQILELQRTSHAASGDVFYWDPYSGDDTNDGEHKNRGMKTFAAAEALCADGHHDLIICVSNDPSGTTAVDENIIITKDSLYVRGTGRDLNINTTSTTAKIIDIQANNVEISGMSLKTPTSHTSYALGITSAQNTLIHDVWIFSGGGKGMLVDGSSQDTIVRNTRIAHNAGDGVTVDGTSEHTAFENCHISSNTGNGVTMTSTGHEISVTEGCVLHNNTGWGIDIDATSTGVHILEGVTLYSNGSGNVNDLASNTYDASRHLIDARDKATLAAALSA